MRAFRKSDKKEIEVNMYYVNNKFAGYVETKPDGVKRFYLPDSIVLKEYYGN